MSTAATRDHLEYRFKRTTVTRAMNLTAAASPLHGSPGEGGCQPSQAEDERQHSNTWAVAAKGQLVVGVPGFMVYGMWLLTFT